METNKPTLKVTILRGASEIGGNLVEVEKLSIGHKIYLDCGLPLFKPHSQDPMAFDLAKYLRWADKDPEAAMKAIRSLGILSAQDTGLFFESASASWANRLRTKGGW